MGTEHRVGLMKHVQVMGTRAWLLACTVAIGIIIGIMGTATAQAEKLSVVATTGMIADAAQAVGGKHVEVRSLMGPGIDPHAYRQTRTDIVALGKADLVLWHGLYLEAQMEEFLSKLSERQAVIAVAESLPIERLIAHDDYADKFDPHVWMVPELWAQVVETIETALIDIKPEAEAEFSRNADAYTDEILALGTYTRATLESVPAEQRVLVTAHDAFNYFGDAYGFEVVGIQGISTESEAGVNRIGELVDLLADRQIGAVFVESSVSDRNIRALIEGAASVGHEVTIGGELFSDAMGEPGTYEGTYLGMIDHNATTIGRALGGNAPELGRLGQLSAGS